MFNIEIYKNNITKDIDDFLTNHKNGSFFESILWGEFNKEYFNKEYFFVVIKNDNEIKLVGLILKNKIFFKYNYLYCPAGPVFDFEDKEAFLFFTKEMRKIAKQNNAIFFRIDPRIKFSDLDKNKIESFNFLYDFFINDNKFKISDDQKQPETTLVIDLEKYNSEEDILKQMKEKGRYNIKIAERNNVTVTKTNLGTIELDRFYKLILETTKRDGFFGNDKDYYKKLLEVFSKENKIFLYSAFYGDEIIASAISVFYGRTVTYYYGASSSNEKYRKMMAPYLLQWEMIKDAKKLNYNYYDFLGVSPVVDEINNQFFVFEGINKKEFKNLEETESFLENHKYNKITQFKTRFGGEVVNYIGAVDKIYSHFIYGLFSILKKIRKTLRKILKARI